jgi:hypothetical protein
MKYSPITSVDVERSFSMYKNISSPNRQRFTEDSLSNMIVNLFLLILKKKNLIDLL